MGELADDVADMFREGDYRRSAPHLRYGLVDRIADLESLVNAQRGAGFVLDDQFNQMGELLDAAGCKTDRTPEAIIAVLTRLADAEQRAAAAWAAVTSVVVRHMRVMDVVDVQPDADGNAFMTGLGTYSQIGGVNKRILLAVLLPSSPANPDLLERASVELAEAYQRQKAEEQRQAEEKAAVAT
mgnify:CR=1 FL=1